MSNSPLLLIKSQTKSTLLKNKIQASPNDRLGLKVDGLLHFRFLNSKEYALINTNIFRITIIDEQ